MSRSGSPRALWNTTTFVGAPRLSGITAPMTLSGAMSGATFLAHVERVPVPTLRPGDIVVMDNLPSHKLPAIREAVERTGAAFRLPPPYSPDFNPIEMAFSKIKTRPRAIAARNSAGSLDRHPRCHRCGDARRLPRLPHRRGL